MPKDPSKSQGQEATADRPTLVIRPLTPGLMEPLGQVFRGSWGRGCWCLFPRLSDAQIRALPGAGSAAQRKRAAMTKLARRRRAPGLIAFEGKTPVGWIAVAPRDELLRVAASRATPPVDDQPVWVIPCVTVGKAARGQGVALALIRAAVAYAGQQGAPYVEAYPRAGAARTGDDNAYFGTEPLFRRAGFQVVRGPLKDRPRNWIPRVAMRIETAK